MTDPPDSPPERLKPHVEMRALNEPIRALPGPFELIGDTAGFVDSDLIFRWLPSAALVFGGAYSQAARLDSQSGWSLKCEEPHFEAPVLVTSMALGTEPNVQGVVAEPISFGKPPIQTLRFCLANFPSYIGEGVSYEMHGSRGSMSGRMRVAADSGECILDVIPEARELSNAAKRDSGFVITHVGEWRPAMSEMTIAEAHETLNMLFLWFGFLRGAWAGPLFPLAASPMTKSPGASTARGTLTKAARSRHGCPSRNGWSFPISSPVS